VRMVTLGCGAERPIDSENHDEENASGNQYKQSHQRLFGFWAHHSLLFLGSLILGLPYFQPIIDDAGIVR
jgi:hypothetical protein